MRLSNHEHERIITRFYVMSLDDINYFLPNDEDRCADVFLYTRANSNTAQFNDGERVGYERWTRGNIMGLQDEDDNNRFIFYLRPVVFVNIE